MGKHVFAHLSQLIEQINLMMQFLTIISLYELRSGICAKEAKSHFLYSWCVLTF